MIPDRARPILLTASVIALGLGLHARIASGKAAKIDRMDRVCATLRNRGDRAGGDAPLSVEEYDRLWKAIPKTAAIGPLVDELRRILRGLGIGESHWGVGVDEGGDGLQRIAIDLSFTSGIRPLIDFLHAVTLLDRFVMVERLTITRSRDSAGAQLDVTLLLSTLAWGAYDDKASARDTRR